MGRLQHMPSCSRWFGFAVTLVLCALSEGRSLSVHRSRQDRAVALTRKLEFNRRQVSDTSNPLNGPNQRGCNVGGVPVDATPFDDSFTCYCNPGYTGDNCDPISPDSDDGLFSKTLSTTEIIVISALGGGCIVVLCVCCIFNRYCVPERVIVNPQQNQQTSPPFPPSSGRSGIDLTGKNSNRIDELSARNPAFNVNTETTFGFPTSPDDVETSASPGENPSPRKLPNSKMKESATALIIELGCTPAAINKKFLLAYTNTAEVDEDSIKDLKLCLTQAGALFHETDVEGTGELTFNQVETTLKHSGSYLAGQELKNIFVRVDDDSNGTLRYLEFANLKALEEGIINDPLIFSNEPYIAWSNGKLTVPQSVDPDPVRIRKLAKLAKIRPGLFKRAKRGKLRVNVELNSDSGQLEVHVNILEAVHLPIESSVVSCKIVNATNGGGKVKRTTVKTGTQHPVYDSLFRWKIAKDISQTSRVVITLHDMKSKRTVGIVSFSLKEIADADIDTIGWFNIVDRSIGVSDNFRFVSPIEASKASESKRLLQKPKRGGSSLLLKPRFSSRARKRLRLANAPRNILELRPMRELGKGAFGRVVSAQNADGHVFAVKCIAKAPLFDNDGYEAIMIEQRVLSRLSSSEFIVRMYASLQSESYLYFILDVIHGGELGQHLTHRGSRFKESETVFYIAEILIGLWYLHDHDIIYRDLKLENILITKEGHVKLSDFGLAKDNIGVGSTTRTMCGTAEYISPEMIQDIPYNRSVDFWALGILIYRLLAGQFPFTVEGDEINSNTGLPSVFGPILDGKIRFPQDFSKRSVQIVSNLLEPDPKNRLGSNEQRGVEKLQAHSFFAAIDWKKAAAGKLKPQSRPTIKAVQATDISGEKSFEDEADRNSQHLHNIDQTVFAGFDWVKPPGAGMSG